MPFAFGLSAGRMNCTKRAVMTLVAVLGMTVPAWADQGEAHDAKDGRGVWHGEIGHFDRDDLQLWRGGRWLRDRHEGRLGWWWVVADVWYFYPKPVYPYPDPYIPPTVVVHTMPPSSAKFWYYCEFSKEYYPYVAICPEKWKVVPAVPVQ